MWKMKNRNCGNGSLRLLVLSAVMLLTAFALGGCGRDGKEDMVLKLDQAAEAGDSDAGAEPGGFGLSDAEADSRGREDTVETAMPDRMDISQRAGLEEVFICVYVCGAVAEPGVVELPEGSRGEDAVALAGGMTQEADTAYVNLAARLSDGEKLFIPTKEEAELLEQDESVRAGGLVNINTADSGELCTLPGIGESRAADIISFRERNGAFAAIEDIMKVPGIKANAFEKIREKIVVR